MTHAAIALALRDLSEDERQFVRPAPARFIEPMRATLTKHPFSHPDWLFERKLDGVRILAVRRNGKVSLFTRNRKAADAAYPEIVAALERVGDPDVDLVVDGEVVAFDDAGRTSFALLQRRMHRRDPRMARATGVAVHYYVFDLLNIDGHDIVGLPLRTRKNILSRSLLFSDPIRVLDHHDRDGEALIRQACADDWEGLIAKRKDSTYVSRRSGDWQKLKCTKGQEFVIGGFTDPQGSRSGFGALLVGYHDGGGRLRYAGKVGTGFDDSELRILHHALVEIERSTSPFVADVDERDAHWVEPIFVCEVAFTEWTIDGHLRHPSFKGIRTDKAPIEVTRER